MISTESITKSMQDLLNDLDKQMGCTDNFKRRIIKILFQCFYFKYRHNTLIPNSYASLMILDQHQILLLEQNLQSIYSGSPISDLMHHKTIKPITNSKIETLIKICNKLYRASVQNIMITLNTSLGSTKKKRANNLRWIKSFNSDTFFIITLNQIRPVQKKDLIWIKLGYNQILHDTDIGSINWLLATNISSYKLHQIGSINKSTIVKLRNHNRKVTNLTLINAIKIERLSNKIYQDNKDPKHKLSNYKIKTNDSLIKENYQINYRFKL